jgi:hypothetical protein
MINASELGVIPPGIVFHGKPTSRKIRVATALYAIHQVGDLVANATKDDSARVAEAERLGLQLVAVAKSNGFILVLPNDPNRSEAVKKLWESIAADANLAPGVVRMEGLVGPNDALIVLDHAIVAT